PSAFARSSDIRRIADAPSVNGDELPAVTDPNFLSNTGGGFASCSRLESRRVFLSVVALSSDFGGGRTGTTSGGAQTLSQPAAALRWLASASSSCASREMPFSLAIFSADSPIESPVVNSAMAGGFGESSAGRNPDRALAFWLAFFARERRMSLRANSREKR